MNISVLHRIKGRVLLTLANWALAKVPTQPSTRVDPGAVPPPMAPTWHAIAGNQLELGSTGFIIKMEPGKGRHTFRLIYPDGDMLGQGEDLAFLKGAAEQRARWRQEFTPAVSGPAATLLQMFMARSSKP
jgi:hypothetical protein